MRRERRGRERLCKGRKEWVFEERGRESLVEWEEEEEKDMLQ